MSIDELHWHQSYVEILYFNVQLFIFILDFDEDKNFDVITMASQGTKRASKFEFPARLNVKCASANACGRIVRHRDTHSNFD